MKSFAMLRDHTILASAQSTGHYRGDGKVSLEVNTHQGRLRSFPHQEGNYATHVYISGTALDIDMGACAAVLCSTRHPCIIHLVMQTVTHLSRDAGKRTTELLQDSRQIRAHVCDGHTAVAVTIPEHVRETLNTLLTFFKHQAPLLQPVLASDAPPSKVTIQSKDIKDIFQMHLELCFCFCNSFCASSRSVSLSETIMP